MSVIGLGKFSATAVRLEPEGFKSSIYSVLLSTLVINILSLALPVMTLQVYDRILPNPGSGTLPVLITGVCLAVLMESVLRLCRAYVMGRSGAVYEHLMLCESMQHVLNADAARMQTYGAGEHLQRIGSVGKLKDFYNGYSLIVLAELLFVPLFLGLIVYISGYLAIVPLVVLVAFADLSFWRGARLRQALEQREKSDAERFDFIIEVLEGIHTVKSFALEKVFARRYEALEEGSCQKNYRVTEETAETFNTGAVFSHVMVAAVITFGAMQVLNGHLTTGGLIAVLLLSGRMMQPVQKGLALWARYQDYQLAKANVEDIFRTPQRQKITVETLPEPAGRVALKDVSFHYHGAEGALLNEVNIAIEPGAAVLISGENRSGKSTLLKMMAGIYSPDSGEAQVDGEDIRAYPETVLPRHVGYISTTGATFRGTIRENITSFGQVSDTQAREVAAMLNVDKDVAKLPGGFDTFLSGNSTDSIPPGLQHRIAMVRVLVHKPRVILFDTADRSLDKEGYAQLYSLLARVKGKATLVLVSDDKNIQALADEFYVLEGGRLVKEEGKDANANVASYGRKK